MTKDTPPNSRGAAEVIQADRDAAARAYKRDGDIEFANACRNGIRDDDPLILAFARHRLNHRTDPSPAYQVLREALERVEAYASDTLSGRADGPTDLHWYRLGMIIVRDGAREALTRTPAQAPLSTEQGDGLAAAAAKFEEMHTDPRSIAVEIVDGIRGYTIELDNFGDHAYWYDRVEALAARALTPAQNSTGEGCEHQAVAGPCSICGDAG